MAEGKKRYQYIKPSINVTRTQIFAIIFIVAIIVSIPIIISYVTSPDRKPLDEIANDVVEYISIDTGEAESEWKATLPLVNTEVNLTLFKQNPQLVIFLGIGSIVVAMILAISLIRNIVRNG